MAVRHRPQVAWAMEGGRWEGGRGRVGDGMVGDGRVGDGRVGDVRVGDGGWEAGRVRDGRVEGGRWPGGWEAKFCHVLPSPCAACPQMVRLASSHPLTPRPCKQQRALLAPWASRGHV
ncbi:unnamed protein product [Closterium sp. NIES-64]|nr:unnamed protein product [Closterium sp. NIES-64]